MSRDRAAEVVATVAERLADAEAVAGAAADHVDTYPDGHDVPSWQPESLADGYPGITLLHAELGDRRGAHGHLIATNRTGAPADDAHRLFAGRLPGLMFGALAAAQRPEEYADLLQQAGTLVATAVQRLAAAELDRISAGGGTGARFAAYDVLSGLSGGLRLLLASGAHPDAAGEAVRALVSLTEPIRPADGGPERPGWYVEHGWSGTDDDRTGHFNLGLSHGVPGVLAVLSIAHRDGVRVAGQAEAIERIVTWLLDREDERSGWPEVVGLSGEVLLATGRPGWCYGGPGLARALYLAGDALDVADWRSTAVRALARTLARPWDEYELREAGLCHGWAGLLQITSRMARDSGDERLASAVPGLADRVLGHYTAEAPFGFRYTTGTTVRMAADRPGFLWGAAGIALALQSYVTDQPPRTDWDAALLLT